MSQPAAPPPEITGMDTNYGMYSYTLTTSQRALCPDLLSIKDMGEADGWRGRLVRGFFRSLKVMTGV